MLWHKLFNSINLNVQTKTLPKKGKLVYEYNPLRNYRITLNMYEYKGLLYSLDDLWNLFGISINCTAHRYKKNNVYNYLIGSTAPDNENVETTNSPITFGQWIKEAYSEGHTQDMKNLNLALINSNISNAWFNVPETETDPYLRESGELVDFVTDELSFSVDNPISIIPQYSYDGSVNLIINDGINIPRLINSRFSATGKNTYEIVDRKGNNDTNIYDLGELFDIDTSLYKRVLKIPKIKFLGVSSGGDLKVGNYHFYFKLSDADGNETDFIGESGVVSVFIGYSDYYSVNTGTKNENSFKLVSFLLSNLDSSYDYVTVYYSRSTAELNDNYSTEYIKINKKYLINNAEICNVIITGFEEVTNIDLTDINLNYNTVDSVVTLATCLNMLFLANVHKPDIPYIELSDLSLRFLPYLKLEIYSVDIDLNYSITTSNIGYIDPLFIYNKTGYWGNEIYRLGIVYILPNGELSPVFNIRGGYNKGEFKTGGQYKYIDDLYTNIPVYIEENGKLVRNYINYNEETFILSNYENSDAYENVKGVVSFNPSKDTNTIYSLDIRVDDDTIQELKKHVKGYFFVRLPRIPIVLALGITVGIDKEAGIPTIPTADGFLSEMSESLNLTHVTTDDINDVNFISEGFLTRYAFKFEEKKSSIWKKIGKITAITIGAVAAVAATIVTAGAAGAVIAGTATTILGAVSAGAGTLTTVAAAAASAVGVTMSGAAAVGVITVGAGAAAGLISTEIAIALEIKYGLGRKFSKKTLDGRNTVAPSGYNLVETEDSRKLSGDFKDRCIIKDSSKNSISGILCPDYELDLAKYNQIFTGGTHLIELTNSLNINCLNGHSSNYFTNDDRHFYVPSYYDRNVKTSDYFKIIGVPDSVKLVGIEDLKFRSKAGEAEEAWRYECIGDDYKSEEVKKNDTNTDDETESNKKINSDIIRGAFGAYLAFNNTSNKFQGAETVNIYIPGYSVANMSNYFYSRMVDNTTFKAISDRIDINNVEEYLIDKPSNLVGYEDKLCGYQYNIYRGDCYICLFTHRLNRNFNDPSAPYNDDIVDANTWKDNYDPADPEKYNNINLGDVNAVRLGMWVTFRIRSSNNLNIRTLDGSNISETAMCGHPKGYYPYHPMSTEGTYKHSDSLIYNKGFSKSLSERWNVELPDIPHIKNWFGTRIMYSDIHINDAFKNGFRVFLGQNYRDYTREYGEIVKLVSLNSNLLCVFEHGVALIPVNERAVAGLSLGGFVYINTSNVLPENPKIISDMFGSLWPESILKVPGKTGDSPQYVYGVDTVAKKIWRTDGNVLLCISDFKVQEFLNNNISLGERELTPKLGIRNVKTVYNAFKRDVLFTFYDNTYGFEEKVWNLCWNELLEKFITFYSWVPSHMENINNIPFSFDRNTSKWIAKLGTSHINSSIADGITLTNVILENKENDNGEVVTNFEVPILYINNKGELVTKYYTVEEGKSKYIGMLSLNNRVLPDNLVFYNISYTLEHDLYGNYKKFEIKPLYIDGNPGIYLPSDAYHAGKLMPLYCLKFKDGGDAYLPIFYKEGEEYIEIKDAMNSNIYTYIPINSPLALLSELYYRNKAGNSYADYDENKEYFSKVEEALEYPIFKDITGKRPTLPRKQMINPDKLVTLLNIRANISIEDNQNNDKLGDAYYNYKTGYLSGTSLVDMGYYESTIAITPKWNLLFLSTDFWKHGLSGIIDIADDIYPTYWYGRLHPFEFEFIVVNDPSIHKIFTNIELVANKAKPESFHYEIIGESYDFAKDKVNMYFRQEAIKALWLYNGADISYNRNFLKVLPKLLPKSADLIHKYYTRLDTINEIEDYYIHITYPETHNYKHLSGGEIVYYPNRLEYRIWNHVIAADIDDFPSDNTDKIKIDSSDPTNNIFGARALIAGNMRYLEDRWKVTINPILICYKNEYKMRPSSESLILPRNSTWTSPSRPLLPVMNSPIPDLAYLTILDNNGNVNIPEVLTNLGYSEADMDTSSWLNDINIYKYSFGEALNRKEIDLKDKFIKIRIRYSGEELAVIDFLNTIYRISYA